MKRKAVLQMTSCALICAFATAQTSVPRFSGTWRLDLKRSSIEARKPPVASTAVIRFDGKTWNFTRTHKYSNKPADTWAIAIPVDAREPQITHETALTISTRVTREGDQVVLHEEYAANTGEKATNTVHYMLEDAGNTLVEDEQEITSKGNEHNLWVLTRVGK